ncbi:hypothetical protein TNCV_626191 [Trichonephila clavipes]|nr:hypothetical protein TNCV_626191 [Trichonephila clavipes]
MDHDWATQKRPVNRRLSNAGLKHRTPDRRAWVPCPMPPNTLQVRTEYVLIKSVGPKDLWTVAAETTGAGGWRIYFPPPPASCLNWGGGDSVVPARISSQSSRHNWRSPLPHASALIQRDFGCVLGVQQTKPLPHVAKVDMVSKLAV